MASVPQAAQLLGVDKTTIYRWLRDGFITGEQLTSGAPWRIRVDQALRDRIRPDVPDGWLPLDQAAKVARNRPADRVAQGPARPAQRRLRHHRTPQRPAYPGRTRSAWTV